MSDLIDTTEMYLKTVYELGEEGIPAMRARIAERLGHTGPTVSQTVARMERDGLLVLSDDRHLELTDEGHRRATLVMRKHRLAERLLVDVVGLDWHLAHEEACRWEHVISEQVERRLLTLLADPATDPYGNPIPGLEQLDGRASSAGSVLPLVEAEGDFELARIGEPAQVDLELLTQMAELGLTPGVRVRVRRDGADVALGVAGAELELVLPTELARHLFVAEVP